MPVGTSKVTLFGRSLVPGGTQTFNSPGTFTVPVGVTKVSITGQGATGSPGNSGTAGNPGNAGTGGTGGSAGNAGNPGTGGGGGFGGNYRGADRTFQCPSLPSVIFPYTLYRQTGMVGGAAGGGPVSGGTQHPCLAPGSLPAWTCQSNFYAGGLSGNAGTAGSSGSAGSGGTAGNPGAAGNPGNPGAAGNTGSSGTPSTGLSQTFSGGAGGNGGAAGNAGSGGSAGNAGNPGSAGTAGSGGTGGEAGYPHFNQLTTNNINIQNYMTHGTQGLNPIANAWGRGGVGAGSGGGDLFDPVYYGSNPTPTSPNSGWVCSYSPGNYGGSPPARRTFVPPPFRNNCSLGQFASGGGGGAGGTNSGSSGNVYCTTPGLYNFNVCNTYGFKPCAGAGGNPGGGAGGRPWVAPFYKPIQSYPSTPTPPPGNPGYWNGAYYPACANAGTGNCRGGGGGGGGAVSKAIFGGKGGGGGGRGNAGNSGTAGNPGSAGNPGNPGNPGAAGNPGSAATPSTVNCLTVSPGTGYPISVGSPGGQITISWNPQ